MGILRGVLHEKGQKNKHSVHFNDHFSNDHILYNDHPLSMDDALLTKGEFRDHFINLYISYKVTFEGYKTVFQDAPFLRWLFNSLFTATLITVATVFSSALSGYIFAKFRFAGKQIIFLVVIATMMIPPQILMIPTYLIIYKLGIDQSSFGGDFTKLGQCVWCIPGKASH